MRHQPSPFGTHHRKKSAFSLVELLVVIAIIGLLMSLMLPSLQKARERSLELKCMANVRSTALAFTQYFQDYKLFIPPLGGSWNYNYGSWVTPITPYIPNVKTRCCPSSGDSYATSWRQRFVTWGDTTTSYRTDKFWNHSETGLVFENAQYLDSIYFMRIRSIVSGEDDTAILDLSSHNRTGIGAAYYDGHSQFIPFTTRQTSSGTYDRTIPFLYKQFWGKIGHNLYTESGHCPF